MQGIPIPFPVWGKARDGQTACIHKGLRVIRRCLAPPDTVRFRSRAHGRCTRSHSLRDEPSGRPRRRPRAWPLRGLAGCGLSPCTGGTGSRHEYRKPQNHHAHAQQERGVRRKTGERCSRTPPCLLDPHGMSDTADRERFPRKPKAAGDAPAGNGCFLQGSA